MSDVSQGPGWWQASDGKWYAPELYPPDWPAPDLGQIEPETVEPVEPIRTEDQPAPVLMEPPTLQVPPITMAPPAAGPGPAPPPSEALSWVPPVSPPIEGDDVPGGLPLPAPGAIPTTDATPGRRRSMSEVTSALLGIVAAALLIVGSTLDWAVTSSADFTGAVNGLSDSNGWGTLITGAVIAAGALLAIAGTRGVWVGAGLGAAALTAWGFVVYSLVDIANLSRDLPSLLVAEDQDPELAVNAGLEYHTGMWLVIAGAGLSLVAGMVALARSSSSKT